MTTLTVIDSPGRDDESLPQAIARRLAGEFGALRLSDAEVARRIGMSQTAFSRRMTAIIPFNTAEVELICRVVGLDRDYILTGARRLPVEPRPGDSQPVARELEAA